MLVAYASRHGQALRDRALDLPQAWTPDAARWRQAGMAEGRPLATTPQRARPMLARVFAVGIPAHGVTGDRVYGDDRRWHMWVEACLQASGLAVAGQASVWRDWQPRPVQTSLAARPEEGWTRLSAGDGAQGPRGDDWRWRPRADPVAGDWRRGWLVRRRLREPSVLRASVVFAPQDAPLAALVRVAGTRWVVERGVDAATGEVGLDHDAVRRWTGGYRPMTRSMWALARLTVRRAGALAGGNSQQTPAARGRTEPPGTLQSPARARLPLTVPEIRRLRWRLVLVVEQTVEPLVAWSRWRRGHQRLAQSDHDKRHGASALE